LGVKGLGEGWDGPAVTSAVMVYVCMVNCGDPPKWYTTNISGRRVEVEYGMSLPVRSRVTRW
jgi:hypothetical protein